MAGSTGSDQHGSAKCGKNSVYTRSSSASSPLLTMGSDQKHMFGEDVRGWKAEHSPITDIERGRTKLGNRRQPKGIRPEFNFRSQLLRLFTPLSIVFLLFVLYNAVRLSYGRHSALEADKEKLQLINEYHPPVPESTMGPMYNPENVSPIEWLRENTYNQPTHTLPTSRLEALIADKPRAAFVALVRNSEEVGMVHSILQLEARFNSRKTHRYDWVFFNNEPFTESFKSAVTNATSSTVHFEQIHQDHWRMPDWIDKSRYDVGRQFQGSIGVGKAWLESYHQMCRWNSGLFALEARLKNYDWYWRVEPDVQYTCNINYDIFRFMRDNNMAYGFNMAILDDARSFPSLWERTQAFKKNNPAMIDREADMRWLLHKTEAPERLIRSGAGYQTTAGHDEQYNSCQFYSNFEIGSLDFFRGREHQAYFQHLDKSGGFFYERYGDAPVHTLSVSMLLPKRRVWFFRDVGYSHGICESCPPHVSKLPFGPDPDPRRIRAAELGVGMSRGHRQLDLLSQDFAKKKLIPGLQYGCTTTALDYTFSKLVPFESKQAKPIDTCIRQWLAGSYLVKKSNWSRQHELYAGGDGYGGYVISGVESNPFADEAITSALGAASVADQKKLATDLEEVPTIHNVEEVQSVEVGVEATPIQI